MNNGVIGAGEMVDLPLPLKAAVQNLVLAILANRNCRANGFLLVPRPRLVGPENFWGKEAPTVPEVFTLLVEKIKVHRQEIADAQGYLDQLVNSFPQYAHLIPKQKPSLVVSNEPSRPRTAA